MKTKIYCRPTDKGVHTFYLMVNNQSYYLFSQKYRKGVHEYYSKGVSIDQSFAFSKSNNDSSIQRTMQKLPLYIKYIEKEYGVIILRQSAKKQRHYA